MARRLSYADLQAKADRLDKENGLYLAGLILTLQKEPDYVGKAQDDGYKFTIKGYRLTAAHGGIVVVQAHCLTHQQTDHAYVWYLDELHGAWQYDTHPNVCQQISAIKVRRQQLIDLEARQREEQKALGGFLTA